MLCLQFQIWAFVFFEWFTVKYWHKVRSLDVVGFHFYAAIVSRIHCCNKLRQFMNILAPIILHVAIQNVFEWPYCTFCKCCFRLTHCRVNFYSFNAAKFLELPTIFCPLIYPNFFALFFLVIIFENVLTVSFESLVFIPFATTVLWDKS